MAAQADQVYKSQSDILAEILAAWLVRLPDANIGTDSLFRYWAEVFSNTAEGLYLGMQLLHDDMFIQTASALALIRSGEMFGRPQKAGVLATGTLTFTGTGGTYIPIGQVFSAPRASDDDSLDFQTTVDGTIPAPGIPTALTAAVGVSGALTGTYEYVVTFTTAAGETAIGGLSNAIVLTAQKGALTNIPIGGPGTTARQIYRRVNGGAFAHMATFGDNTTTTFTDNVSLPSYAPPTESTAEGLTLAAAATQTGTDWNVDVGTITDISDAPAGLSGVTNAAPFTGGTDPEDIRVVQD